VESDQLLVNFGVILSLYAILMIVVYLLSEKGSFLDPIPVSWGGYLIFFALAMLFTGIANAPRRGEEQRSMGVILMCAAAVTFTIGLYSGRGAGLARLLPKPRPTLDTGQAWLIWGVAMAIALTGMSVVKAGETEFLIVFGALILGATATVVLVALLAIFTFRGSWFTKFVMVTSMVLAFTLVYYTSFSRRPTLALFAATLATLWYVKIRFYNAATKAVFVVMFLVGGLMLNLYLESVRANIYYGDVARREQMFSARNIAMNLGGVTVGYEVYEMMLDQYPQNHDFLLGRGIYPAFIYYIPRRIWENKPYGSGWIATQIWFSETNPVSNVSPLPIGEIYMNFGIPGVLFGFFVIGRLVRIANTYLRQNPHNVVIWLAYFIVIPDLLGQWRGDFTSMTAQGTNRIIIFIVLAWIAGRVFPVPERPVIRAPVYVPARPTGSLPRAGPMPRPGAVPRSAPHVQP
jgi:hypothetical protein